MENYMIIPPNYTPVQIIVPNDRKCHTVKGIWDHIRYINNLYSNINAITKIKSFSYISHLSLARTYNLIYALIKTDKLNFLNYPYTEVPLISAGNIEFYKLNYFSELTLKEENDIKEIVTYDGIQLWYKYGELHRDNDLAAIIEADGSQLWYKNGYIHRDNDLPAVIEANGKEEYWENGLRHRDNGLPALIHPNGKKEWWINGERHRDNDLPAVIKSNGTQLWYKNGKLHRDNDLPSVIKITGTKLWYKNGKKYANPS